MFLRQSPISRVCDFRFYIRNAGNQMHKQTSSTTRKTLINELMQRWNIHLCQAIRVVGSVEAGEDVLQNTALKCLTTKPGETPEYLGRYVSGMVRNAAIDYLRKHKREIPVSFDEEDQLIRAGTTSLCGQIHLEKRQELQRVIDALFSMPNRSRDALLRHRLNGIKQNQIAKELSVSPTLVNFIIKDADQRCRQAIDA